MTIKKSEVIEVLENIDNRIRTEIFFDSTPTLLIDKIKRQIQSLPEQSRYDIAMEVMGEYMIYDSNNSKYKETSEIGHITIQGYWKWLEYKKNNS